MSGPLQPSTSSRPSAGGPTSLFTYRSRVPVAAAELFGWHERPDALLALMPRRWARIEAREGGIRDGGRVVVSMGAGPFRLRWEARHFGYIRDRQFCDEQVGGPFATWRHTHRVEPTSANESLYEDRVEYALRGGRLVNRLLAPALRPLLARAFAHRHRIVRESLCAGGRSNSVGPR